MIETIHPKDEAEWLALRTKDITSTESAALFGVSPYITEFELWHRKKDGKVYQIEASEPMVWGSRLQDSIAEGVAKDNGFKISKMTEYMRDSELRMGSSFDFAILDEFGKPVGILEIKNVMGSVFKEQWLEDDQGNFEAPPHIELQVQHQLAVSGRAFAYIAALVNGNKVVLIKREPDAVIIQAIKDKVKKFWESIESDSPPPPVFEQDSKFISKLYGFSEPGKLLLAQDDVELTTLADKYSEYSAAESEAKKKKDAIKAEILMMIGDAEKVQGEGFSITASMVSPADISYHREGYRTFKINRARSKK